jgi:hypothetical protein
LIIIKKTLPNTDNKINRFVTVFAYCSCSLDSYVKQYQPGYPHLLPIKLVYPDSILASM